MISPFFQVLQCAFLIFHVFQVSSHIPGPGVSISHFALFSLFLAFSSSYSVCVSCSTFFSFLAIFQVLHCVCLILHVFQVSLHIPGPTMIFSCFSFVSFLDIIKVITLCVSHFPSFSSFSQYSRYYSGHFSSFKFFSASRHIPGPTVCVSHFPRLSFW